MLPLCLIVAADGAGAPASNGELGRLGLKPCSVDSFAAALGLMRQWQFDAVLVDADGFAATFMRILPELSERAKAPIVLLWSELDERSQIQSLASGATAIVSKPASAELIAAKLHRLLGVGRERSAEPSAEPADVRLGPLRLDPRRAKAAIGETVLALTAGEFELLLLLASRPGEFVHRDGIARALHQPGPGPAKRRSADMHVCRIRKKLRDAGARTLQVETVYGRGYCLRLEPDARDATVTAPLQPQPQWCA